MIKRTLQYLSFKTKMKSVGLSVKEICHFYAPVISGKIDMNVFNNGCDHSRFITIMSNTDSKILCMLSKFLLNCFKIKQDHPK